MNRKWIWWPFKPPHKHRGKETGRRYVSSIFERAREFEAKGFVNDNMLYGYTEITYKCNECGAYFINRYVGKIIDESKD